MDIEIIQKYKAGGSGEYVLVYKSEGRDDPFNDMTRDSEELTNEITINLTGEVTLAATMDDELGKILDTYGGGETVTIAAYARSAEVYGAAPEEPVEAAKAEEEE